MKGSEDRKNRLRSIISAIAELRRKHWVVALVLLDLSAIWLPILYTFLGSTLGLVTVNGQACQFSPIGFCLMVFFLLLIAVVEGSTVYDNRTRRDDESNSEIESLVDALVEQTENGFVLRDIKDSTNKICESKLLTLTEAIDGYVTYKDTVPPQIISDPKNQLENLSKELSECLARLLKFKERRDDTDVFTSMLYRFPQEDSVWKWATSERGLPIAELFGPEDRNPKSSIESLIGDVGHTLFFNSKQQALENGKYIPDDEDEYDNEGHLKGSIACYQFEIKKNDRVVVEAAFSITSYRQKFVEDAENGDDMVQNVRFNIERVLMHNYILRAKIELCLLYLQYLHDSRSLPQHP